MVLANKTKKYHKIEIKQKRFNGYKRNRKLIYKVKERKPQNLGCGALILHYWLFSCVCLISCFWHHLPICLFAYGTGYQFSRL